MHKLTNKNSPKRTKVVKKQDLVCTLPEETDKL